MASNAFKHMVVNGNAYVIAGLLVLTGILGAQHRWESLCRHLKDCVEISTLKLGPSHRVCVTYRYIYEWYDSSTKAVPDTFATRALEMQYLQQTCINGSAPAPGRSPNSIVYSYFHAWTLLNAGMTKEAFALATQILDVSSQLLGMSNYVTTATLYMLSRAEFRSGDCAKAIEHIRSALEEQVETLGIWHPERMNGYYHLGEMYSSIHDTSNAERAFTIALVGQRTMLSLASRITIRTAYKLLEVLREKGDLPASACLRRDIDDASESNATAEIPLQAY